MLVILFRNYTLDFVSFKKRTETVHIKTLKAKKEFNIDSDPLIRIQVGFVHR